MPYGNPVFQHKQQIINDTFQIKCLNKKNKVKFFWLRNAFFLFVQYIVWLCFYTCFHRKKFLLVRNGIIKAQAQFRMYRQRKRYLKVRQH